MIGTVENDTGRAGIDQPLYLIVSAGLQDVAGAFEVGAEVQLARPPDAGDSCGVKHAGNVSACRLDGSGIAQIAAADLDAGSLQLRVRAAAENPDGPSGGEQLFDDVASEKTATAGDKTNIAHEMRQGKTFRWGNGGARGIKS